MIDSSSRVRCFRMDSDVYPQIFLVTLAQNIENRTFEGHTSGDILCLYWGYTVFVLNSKSNTLHTERTALILICKPTNPIFVQYFERAWELGKFENCSISVQSLPACIRPSIDRRIEQRQCSTRIPLLHIISLPVGFRGFTEWSRNILSMEVRRAYLLCCWPLVHRENLWRRSSGSDGGAVFTNCSCFCVLHGKVSS